MRPKPQGRADLRLPGESRSLDLTGRTGFDLATGDGLHLFDGSSQLEQDMRSIDVGIDQDLADLHQHYADLDAQELQALAAYQAARPTGNTAVDAMASAGTADAINSANAQKAFAQQYPYIANPLLTATVNASSLDAGIDPNALNALQHQPSQVPDPLWSITRNVGDALAPVLLPNVLSYGRDPGNPTLIGTMSGFAAAAGNFVLGQVPTVYSLNGSENLTALAGGGYKPSLIPIGSDQRLGNL